MQVPECITKMKMDNGQRYKPWLTSAVEKSIPLPDSMLCNRFLTCLCNLGWSSYDRRKFNIILGYYCPRYKTYKSFRNSYTCSSYSFEHSSIHACLRVMPCFFTCRPYHARPFGMKCQRWRYVWSHFRQFRFEMSFVRTTNGGDFACGENVFWLEQAIMTNLWKRGQRKLLTISFSS